MRDGPALLLALLVATALPSAGADDFPLPPASRRNDALSGASTLAPLGSGTRITRIVGPQ